jgi:UDP-glucose 4-epimerase
MRRVLVTGCTGLVGHGVTLTLLERGWQVFGSSRHPLRARHPGFHPVQLELNSEESLTALPRILKEVDCVIHNAAKLPVPGEDDDASWEECYRVNVAATRRLLIESASRGVMRFVYISASPNGLLDHSSNPVSETALYSPRNAYAASKACAEVICRQFDQQGRLPVAVLRFPAPYGYRGSRAAVLPRFVDRVRRGEPITLWGSGERQQAFTFVEDIGQACIKMLELGARGVFQIAGPDVVTMKQLAAAVLTTFPGTGSRIVYEGKPDPQEGREVLISIEKARRELGFEPSVPLLAGLQKIAQADESVAPFEGAD